MSNVEIWDKLKQPPKSALKEIKAGRLAGKSDINPQWRMQAMTEVFGPCGIGWKYTIDKLWTEPGAEGQVCAFALVSVMINKVIDIPALWSAPIQGIGGSMLIAKEKAGLYTSDEAYKMAVTDALSVALKALGVAADIYLGNFDGSKYKTPPPAKDLPSKPAEEPEPLTSPAALEPPPPSPEEEKLIKHFFARLHDIGLDEKGKDIVKKYICGCCSVDSTKLLTAAQLSSAIKWTKKFLDAESILNYIIEQEAL